MSIINIANSFMYKAEEEISASNYKNMRICYISIEKDKLLRIKDDGRSPWCLMKADDFYYAIPINFKAKNSIIEELYEVAQRSLKLKIERVAEIEITDKVFIKLKKQGKMS